MLQNSINQVADPLEWLQLQINFIQSLGQNFGHGLNIANLEPVAWLDGHLRQIVFFKVFLHLTEYAFSILNLKLVHNREGLPDLDQFLAVVFLEVGRDFEVLGVAQEAARCVEFELGVGVVRLLQQFGHVEGVCTAGWEVGQPGEGVGFGGGGEQGPGEGSRDAIWVSSFFFRADWRAWLGSERLST